MCNFNMTSGGVGRWVGELHHPTPLEDHRKKILQQFFTGDNPHGGQQQRAAAL